MNCEIGIEWIGYTMICFGVANTICSPISGVLGKRVGRPTLFIVATALNISALVAMELWHLARKQLIVFFVIPGIWGLADSIWQTQSAGKCGIDSIYRCNNTCITISFSSYLLQAYCFHTKIPVDIIEHVLSLHLRHTGLPNELWIYNVQLKYT